MELRKRNEQIKELQLDLRIANREIKNLKGASEANEKIRGQADDMEKTLQEKTAVAEKLRVRVAELEEEVESAKELAQKNELAAETEQLKLQERLRMLQDTTSTQSVRFRKLLRNLSQRERSQRSGKSRVLKLPLHVELRSQKKLIWQDLQQQLATFSDQLKEAGLKCKMLEKEAEMANRRKQDALKQLEESKKELKQVNLGFKVFIFW